MRTRTNHDGADEQTWYAVMVDERYCLDSLNVDDALAEARRIADANPRLSCRLVSFPVPRGRDHAATCDRPVLVAKRTLATCRRGCAHRGGRRGFDVRRVVSPPVPLAAVDPLREQDQSAHGNSARRDDRDRDGDLEGDCGGHPAEHAAGHGQRSCELGGNDPSATDTTAPSPSSEGQSR